MSAAPVSNRSAIDQALSDLEGWAVVLEALSDVPDECPPMAVFMVGREVRRCTYVLRKAAGFDQAEDARS